MIGIHFFSYHSFIHYRYDLYYGIDPKQSQRKLTLNTEHTVNVSRYQQAGTLKVDDEPEISVMSPGNSLALDCTSYFYVGGVPQLSSVRSSAVVDVDSLKGFDGCVISVTVRDTCIKIY